MREFRIQQSYLELLKGWNDFIKIRRFENEFSDAWTLDIFQFFNEACHWTRRSLKRRKRRKSFGNCYVPSHGVIKKRDCNEGSEFIRERTVVCTNYSKHVLSDAIDGKSSVGSLKANGEDDQKHFLCARKQLVWTRDAWRWRANFFLGSSSEKYVQESHWLLYNAYLLLYIQKTECSFKRKADAEGAV